MHFPDPDDPLDPGRIRLAEQYHEMRELFSDLSSCLHETRRLIAEAPVTRERWAEVCAEPLADVRREVLIWASAADRLLKELRKANG